jgi:hypothetical protein
LRSAWDVGLERDREWELVYHVSSNERETKIPTRGAMTPQSEHIQCEAMHFITTATAIFLPCQAFHKRRESLHTSFSFQPFPNRRAFRKAANCRDPATEYVYETSLISIIYLRDGACDAEKWVLACRLPSRHFPSLRVRQSHSNPWSTPRQASILAVRVLYALPSRVVHKVLTREGDDPPTQLQASH